MKNGVRLLIISLALSLNANAQQYSWVFDPAECNIQFSATHMGISEVIGNFQDFGGEVISNKSDFTDAVISFYIYAKSLNTENNLRDNQLKSSDFLAIGKYPLIQFKSTRFSKIDATNYVLSGKLTIKNKEKPIVFDVIYGGTVKDNSGTVRAGFKVTGTIDRFDFDMTWNDMLRDNALVVGKTIDIDCNIQIVKTH